MVKQQSIVELDPILAELGAFGKYNIVNYAFLLFPVLLAGIYGSIYVFEAPDINYRCQINECDHIENASIWLENAIPLVKDKLSKCTRYPLRRDLEDNVTCTASQFLRNETQTCNDFVYSDEDSIVKDFDLGCQNAKRTLVGTVHNSALFISLPLTGIMSDKYGRKTALAVASLMNGIFGLIRSFSVNYEMLLVFEFLEPALGAGAYSTAFVLAVELVGPKGRVFGNTIINVVYVIGLMTLATLSWQLQSWRTVLQVVYTPALFVFSYLWILNESVRWLISKGRFDEAVKILNKAAKYNKVELSDDLLAPLCKGTKETLDETQKDDNADEKSESTFVKVIKSSVIRKRVVVCSFLWIPCTFVYYGLSINSVSLAGSKYVNFILVSFVEIPANFVCLLVLDKFGRKRTLIITYVLSACLCMSLSFVPKGHSWWSLILFLSGKFSITIAYSTVYVYVSEVFPTSLRQSLLAICSSLGRVGSTLAPLTPLLALYYDNLPAIFFGGMALVASVLVFTLPETINMPLPDTIEEAELMSRRKTDQEA